jgi:hypothetical protein
MAALSDYVLGESLYEASETRVLRRQAPDHAHRTT